MVKAIAKLTEGHHPYAATRAKVLKSLLISKGDYDKLIKMSLPEIAAFLQNTQYKEEFNQLGVDFTDIELFERALNLNMSNTARKLRKIISTSNELKIIVGTYLKKLDIYNIKQIIRGKFSGLNEEDIKTALIPGGSIRFDRILELMKKDKIADIAAELDKSEEMANAIKYYDLNKNLLQIENVLDYRYYERLMAVAKAVSMGSLLERFLNSELDFLNIKILLRLNRAGLEHKEIMEHLRAFGFLGKQFFDSASRESFDNIISRMEKTKYGKIISDEIKKIKEHNSLMQLEAALDRELLKQSGAFLRIKPLSANPVLGFLIAKEIEIRNLRMMTRAKHSKLDENFMKEQLVTF